MPAYSSTTPNTAIYAGDPPFFLFNNEVVAAGNTSQRFASTAADDGGTTVGYTFCINWAAAPTATVVIQSADVDLDANYLDTEFSSTIQNDQVTVTTRHRFFRAKVTAFTAGGALTVYVVK